MVVFWVALTAVRTSNPNKWRYYNTRWKTTHSFNYGQWLLVSKHRTFAMLYVTNG